MKYDFVLSLIFIIFYFRAISETIQSDLQCVPKDFGHGSIVCVCNSTYCDEFSVPIPVNGSFIHVESTKVGKRFFTRMGQFANPDVQVDVSIFVNRSQSFQRIIGFGGAFTDAAGLNIASLTVPLQKTIIEQYFSETGLNYNLARVPIAGTDFSTRAYSYDDEYINDTSLEHFQLQMEDVSYKIPYIKMALEKRPNLKIFASPWSAPKWMKTNNAFNGFGSLKREFYQTWANYFIKFLDSYAQHNISFWAVTTQNEPFDGFIPFFPFNCMGWTAQEQRDWIKLNLGPTLNNSIHKNVKIIILDDNRILLPYFSNVILEDPEAAKYVSGFGLHWYLDEVTPIRILDLANEQFPNVFMLGTEACIGSSPWEDHVLLGSWERAERYASSIIQDLNHFVAGWTDWNLALDMTGGPNWINNFVDSPIIIDKNDQVVYKNPMFYAVGHFSKFIPEGATRIFHKASSTTDLEILSCKQRVDQRDFVSLIIMNRQFKQITIKIQDSEAGRSFSIQLSPQSINSIMYS